MHVGYQANRADGLHREAEKSQCRRYKRRIEPAENSADLPTGGQMKQVPNYYSATVIATLPLEYPAIGSLRR